MTRASIHPLESIRAPSDRAGLGRTLHIASVSLLILNGCGGRREAPDPDIPATAVSVPFVSLMDLQYSNLDRDARIVVRTLAEWENLWAAATEDLQPAEEAPAVDFGRRMVLVVAMGRRGTGGFHIRIGSVYEDRERLYVVRTETSPGSGSLLTQGLTAPVSAVSVPRSTKSATFVRRTATLTCG